MQPALLPKRTILYKIFTHTNLLHRTAVLRLTAGIYLTALLLLPGSRAVSQTGNIAFGQGTEVTSPARTGSAAKLYAEGKYTQARAAFLAEREQAPDNLALQQGYIRTLHRLDDWKPALAEARALVARNPDSAEAHGLLSVLLMRAGLPDEANRAAEFALNKNPQQVDALITRARIQLWNRKLTDARNSLRQALSIQPTNIDAAYYLSDTYGDLVSPDLLKDIDTYIALKPKGHPHDIAMETLPSLRTFIPNFLNDPPFHASAPVSETDLKQADTGDKPITTFTSPFETSGNYVIMPARIDGQLVRLLFDTGGGFSIALYKKAASRLKLEAMGKSFVRGVNGREASVQAKANTMQVGNETFRAIPIDMLNSNNGDEDGIFGVSNFDQYAVTIDFKSREISLARGKNAVAPPTKEGNKSYQVPFHLMSGDILLPIQVEGESLWALLDTGADAEMILSLDVARSIAARRNANSFLERRMDAQVGLGNTVKQQNLLIFKDPVQISIPTNTTNDTNHISIPDGMAYKTKIGLAVGADLVDTQVSPSMMFQIGGILGIEFLRKATRVTIDYPHRLLTLEYTAR